MLIALHAIESKSDMKAVMKGKKYMRNICSIYLKMKS